MQVITLFCIYNYYWLLSLLIIQTTLFYYYYSMYIVDFKKENYLLCIYYCDRIEWKIKKFKEHWWSHFEKNYHIHIYTLSKVGLYLPRLVFTHGQLYVTVSRVKFKKELKILILNKDENISNSTTNVI